MVLDRTVTHLRQFARRTGQVERLGLVLATLETILPELGERSHSRVMQNRIGELLFQKTVKVIAPSCPDYSHEDGLYTFTSVGSWIPLLAVQHHGLLEPLLRRVPQLQCEILVADGEASDSAIQNKVGLSEAAFQARIAQSIDTARRSFKAVGIEVLAMSERFPTLQSEKARLVAAMRVDEHRYARFASDTIARSPMYRKLGITDPEVMLERTIRTAAEYAALATLTKAEGVLICNHETVNLSWYTDYGAALLHNPVRLY
jgi:hypothetical protein